MLSLWGFMGAGKSTIGKHLAQHLQLPIFDTDVEIEKREGASIAEIFRSKGESYFREAESRLLKELTGQLEQHKQDLIILTGGGMPLREQNRDLLQRLGKSVFIHVAFDEIVQRLKDDQTRPLWEKEQLRGMREKYDQRLPIYQQADITLDATEKTIEDICVEILQYTRKATKQEYRQEE